MQIIHVTAGIQETCGVSQYVVNTARAQQAAGHDVTIVTTMTCGCFVDDLQVIVVADPVATLERLAAEGVELVLHVHMMWNVYVHHAVQWCRMHQVSYVYSPHGALSRWAMRFKWWKKIPCWWLWQRRDLKCAAAFHVTAATEESDIRRLGFAQPVVVAPLGCDLFIPSNQEISNLRSDNRDVVFVGRIHPVKNLDSLVRAWTLLGKKGKPCRGGEGEKESSLKFDSTFQPFNLSTFQPRLVIAGSNDVGHQEKLVGLAISLGLRVVDFSRELEFGKKTVSGGGEVPVETFQRRLADCDADVVFTGPVYSTAKDWMFSHAWVTVLPSHSENFGGVVIESLAQGTPVVASTGTPWGELEEWKCGRWIEPTTEKIAEVLSEMLTISEKERESMSMAARELVGQKYSWKASAAKVVEQYEKVLQSERGMAV